MNPTKIYQVSNNDCFSACLATLFGKTLHEVPVFTRDNPTDFDGFLKDLNQWLAQQGWTQINMTTENIDSWEIAVDPSVFLIGLYKTHEGKESHAVVLKGSEIYHDPKGKITKTSDDIWQIYFFLPLSPSRQTPGDEK